MVELLKPGGAFKPGSSLHRPTPDKRLVLDGRLRGFEDATARMLIVCVVWTGECFFFEWRAFPSFVWTVWTVTIPSKP